MITIYKYPIENMINEFELPVGARIIKADYDPMGVMCLWAAVDTNVETESVKILKIGTGWPLDEYLQKYEMAFIDTVKEDIYVWHIFRIRPKSFAQAANACKAMAYN